MSRGIGTSLAAEREGNVGRRHTRARGRRRGVVAGTIGVFGEVLLTLGVVLLLFVVWQLWWTNLEADATQSDAVQGVSRAWDGQSNEAGSDPTHPIEGKVWGILYVPRFGAAYAKPIAEGTSLDVLDTIGVGHYADTQRPGQKGNVALAGHRQTHGQVFWDMDKLQDGDKAYIQTKDGIYTYTFRSRSIVAPSQGEVVLPVPDQPGAQPEQKLLTLTTCHPPFTTRMRMIVHFEQTSFSSADRPAPAAIADLVATTTGKGA